MSTSATESWAAMTPAERRQSRIEQWLAPAGVEFQSAAAQNTYTAGVTRLVDAIECKKLPDRVPIIMTSTFMPADLYGVAPFTAMYEPEALASTFMQFLVDYKPDYYFTPALIGSGQVLELLGYKQYKWPGHGLSKDQGYQYVEDEYMVTEDYQALIDDPSDFWLRRYLPRTFGALEPLSRIPAFTELWEIVLVSAHMIPFGTPDVQDALRALMDAGRAALAWAEHIGRFEAEAKSLGFVSAAGGVSKAPFDLLADTVRGTRATMFDMRRRPDTLLQAVERLTPLAIKQGVAGATAQGNPIVFMPLHKGADGFMSDEQFRTLYWPSLKAVVLGLVEEGCIPFLFCEGGFNSRLEYLAEIPAGTSFCIFDRTDMRTAKEVLGGRVCIGGNVPASMIMIGTADAVRAYCKELIDDVAPGGGYIMSFGTAMDEGKPDTVHAMVDFTREYGVYS